eukprot:1161882-Pelagomonas_calceolata.AAC.5
MKGGLVPPYIMDGMDTSSAPSNVAHVFKALEQFATMQAPEPPVSKWRKYACRMWWGSSAQSKS